MDWPDYIPDYLPHIPSSTTYPPLETFTGGDFILPDAWAEETDSDSCGRESYGPAADTIPTSVPESPPLDRPWPEVKYEHQSTFPSSPPISQMMPKLEGIPAARKKSKHKDDRVSSKQAKLTESTITMDGGKTSNSERGHNVQLRTASRKAKSKRTPPFSSTQSPTKSPKEKDENDSLTVEERRARHSHNIVEKQYRNRLNAQFERLLAALPADQRNGNTGSGKKGSGSDGDHAGAMAEEKRMSKADVLDLATQRIKTLEEERQRLQEERNELIQGVDAMTNAITSQGRGR